MISTPRITAKYVTLGCKLNFSETATIASMLRDRGVESAAEGDVPQLCVVNTCSVTEEADKKCRQHIRSLIKHYPDALMVVTGCYAQLKAQEISEIPGVDIVLGSEQKLQVVDYIDRWLHDGHKPEVQVTRHTDIHTFSPACERGDRTRYFLKVQDGCDAFCTYCTIPMARGRSRSGSISSLVQQVREVVAEGGREVVIAGVNIGDFGKNTGERFIDLIRAFDAIEGIERYRISSIEPDLLTDEIIDFCAHSRAFMPHFHIPLQSGNDEVLQLMHRRYDRALFAHKIERIRQAMPLAFIGVDVMVGCRGETPERFEDSLAFIGSLPVQHLHVFPYSERPGTAALRIPIVVPQREKQQRVARMMELSQRKEREWAAQFQGTVRPVLLEHPHGHGKPMHGYTDNYLRVTVPAQPELSNTVVPIRLTHLHDSDITFDGQVVQE